MSARDIARATILVVAGGVVGLAVVEAGLRAIGFSSHLERPRSGVFTQVTEYDPVLSRRNRPGFVDATLGIRIDSLGFRGEDRQAVAGSRMPAALRLSPERFEANLRRFVQVGREIGERVIFIDFPYRDVARGLSPGDVLPNPIVAVDSIEALYALYDQYQRVVERVATSTDTPLVRTAAVLHAIEHEAFSDYDVTHPMPAGQQVIARAILDEIERQGVLTPRPAAGGGR